MTDPSKDHEHADSRNQTLPNPGHITFFCEKDVVMPSRYSQEVKSKAVRLVVDHRADYATEWEAIGSVSARLGMSAETLRKWLRQFEVDAGSAAGVTTASAKEIRDLKRKNAELERTIEILKAATSFFARELDPPRR
jgi:transposase